jgi:hypothetical protein
LLNQFTGERTQTRPYFQDGIGWRQSHGVAHRLQNLVVMQPMLA